MIMLFSSSVVCQQAFCILVGLFACLILLAVSAASMCSYESYSERTRTEVGEMILVLFSVVSWEGIFCSEFFVLNFCSEFLF